MSVLSSRKPSRFVCLACAVAFAALMVVIAVVIEFQAFMSFANPDLSFFDALGIVLRVQVGVALMAGLSWGLVYAADSLPKED